MNSDDTSPGERALAALKRVMPESADAHSGATLRELRDVIEDIGRRVLDVRAPDEDRFHDACTDALMKCRRSPFRGGSPGEAYNFLRVIVRRAFFDLAPPPEIVSPPPRGVPLGSAPIDAVSLRRLLERVIERGRATGNRGARIEVFVGHRLGDRQVPTVLGPYDTFVRARNRLYQDRAVGQRYYVEVLGELVRDGTLDENDHDLGMKLVSERGGSWRLSREGND